MERAQVRAAATCKKKEERKAKGKEGVSSSAPKVVEKGGPKGRLTGRITILPRKLPSLLGILTLRKIQLLS